MANRLWESHRHLIEALSRLSEDVGLVVVGEGPQRRNDRPPLATEAREWAHNIPAPSGQGAISSFWLR
jgi:hypothetical protein